MNRSILKDKAITSSLPDITFTEKVTDITACQTSLFHTHARARA
jgi:hypothetical protein